MIAPYSPIESAAPTMREALDLVRDLSSQEWQQPDGKRMGATDNQGRRMWFITEDVMQVVRDSLGEMASPAPSGQGDPMRAWNDGVACVQSVTTQCTYPSCRCAPSEESAS